MYRTGSIRLPSDTAPWTVWNTTGAVTSGDSSAYLHEGSGELCSRWIQPDFAPHELIVSWNSTTADGGTLEVFAQAAFEGGKESAWVSFGMWSTAPGTERGSRRDQTWESYRVVTDTFVSDRAFTAFRLRVAMTGPVELHGISACWSDPKTIAARRQREPHRSAARDSRILSHVPQCSQMVFPDGGNTWCSPTSLAMVMEYWNRTGRDCTECVHATRGGVYDPVYGGHGNWVFNAAWAGEQGFDARILRFCSFDALEPWIEAGVPLVLSVAWNNEAGRRLAHAPVPKSNGHLTVLVGFDENGNAVMNEPASAANETVRRTYDRNELEDCWLAASGGCCYVVYPRGTAIPDECQPGGNASIIAS